MNRIANILVIVDPTASHHPCIAKAALLAQQLDARLDLFVCDTRAVREMRVAAHSRRTSNEPLMISVKAMLEALAKPLRERGLDVTTECECGDPLHEALIARIRHSTADLVVKDTHHHTIAQRTFLTNTDWQLIRGSPAALLLTKATLWHPTPRIVAAVDPGHLNDKPAVLDERILECSAALAKALNGELHAAHAYIPMEIVATVAAAPPLATTFSAVALADEDQVRREQVGALTRPYGIRPGNVHVEFGAATEFLPRLARTVSADILVMGAISRKALQRIFIGHTAEQVLEYLPCDALIVKPPNFAELLPI